MIKINIQCRHCNKVFTLDVDAKKYVLYRNGVIKAQDAFGHLKAAERELFISNTCGECWDEMFKDIEEEEDDD